MLIEEIKFFKSFNDIKMFYDQKFPYFLARIGFNPFINSTVPAGLQIEPTSHCNINCICCSGDRVERKKGYMDFELFKKIIDEASEIGVKRVHLFFLGEAMLHPQIVDMIHYIKTNGLGMTMHTNGMLFNKENIKAILNSGVNSGDYFIFSVLAHSKELHEKIMKGVNHETVLKNILDFLELRKQEKINGPIVEVIFYPMPENNNEKEQYVKYWRGIVDHVHMVDTISYSLARYENPHQTIPLREKTCSYIWERMTICWNGDVALCNQDINGDHLLGNLREQSIKEIWNGDNFLSIKQLHKENKFEGLPLCARCDQ